MKWSVVVLIVLGFLAAISAALLVRAFRTERMVERYGRGATKVVVAARSLPAMSWITSQNIAVTEVPRKGLPVDRFADPIEVIGKVLAVPVVKDQVLTKSCLITEGSGAQLAAALPHGMRAVSVPVLRSSVMSGLLYPGCMVDVIATFRLRLRGSEKGEAISTTLLQGVQVLAVQDESVVSKGGQQEQKSTLGGSSSRAQLTVTLMVDSRQAEALQLAMDNGKIILAMKNPLDRRPMDSGATVLSEDRLAKLGELLGPSVFAVPSETDDVDVNNPEVPGDPNSAGERSVAVQDKDAERLRRLLGGDVGGSRHRPQWEVTVIRGKEVKEEVLEIPESNDTAQRESK